MKFGFVLSWVGPKQAVEYARVAEEAGWDGVFTWDGVSLGGTPVYDPWSVLAGMALVTERVTLGAMVFPLARRRPWNVVKQAVTIDHFSDGRLVLPVGLGSPDDGGFSRVSTDTVDRRTRAQRLDETLEILALAQSGEPFSWNGEHYRADDLQLAPRPVQERIPVWAVGAWPHERSLRRAARWDGIIPTDLRPGRDPFDPLSPAVLREVVDDMAARRGGRPFEVVMEGRTDGPDDAERPDAYAAAGATWFIESRWDEADDATSLLRRIQAGPPRSQA
ncbi:LLM class flavin-dependent oxidoreductase [Microbacterium gorillae]|uniref:LLM class flavin-dependent oxidoreductase n=1 Tax=Microbacterium gorillae TaxID=1231063 RepID=UPI0005909416|nr:LLM class flavin-dependent oxidoreductase [Microbacterium gorillae]